MKISLYLTRPKAKESTSIFARLSYSGYQLKYYTPESINPKYWSKEAQLAKQTDKFKEYPEFNQRLTDWQTDVKNLYRKWINDHGGTVPNPDTLKALLDKELKKIEPQKEQLQTFLGFFQSIIEQTKKGVRLHPKTGQPIQKNTVKTYVTTFKHLKEFQAKRKKPIEFDSINLDFYCDYTEYLMKGKRPDAKTGKLVSLNLSTNTVGKHIQIIKLILNEATERGLNKYLSYKSKRFFTVREKSDSIYLSEAEINELENLELDNNRLDNVRDLFLIGCYTGLRYSDYSILKPEQIENGFISTTQIKTGDAVVIPVHPTVQKILLKYGGKLPRSISNQKTNEYLKELGKKLPTLNTNTSKTITKGGVKLIHNQSKWEFLSSHTARRSFATNEYLAGTPSITIMAITGHKTERAFLKYIKLTPNEHAKLMQQHWQKRAALKVV